MLFMHGKRFYLEMDVLNASIVPSLCVTSIAHSRVIYQCLAHDPKTGNVQIYIEVDGVLRPEDVGSFFANLADEAVECTPIRTQKRSRRVWGHVHSRKRLCGFDMMEVGKHGFFLDRKTAAPAAKPIILPAPVAVDSKIVLQRQWLEAKIAACEHSLANPAPPTKPSAALPADAYWRQRCAEVKERMSSLQLEMGGSPADAFLCARDAFLDLKRQVEMMDTRVHEKTFELFDLRRQFNLNRAEVQKRGHAVGSWDEWTVLAADEKAQCENNALQCRLRELQLRVEAGRGEDLDAARKGSGTKLQRECAAVETQYLAMRAEYREIDRIYCQDGLRAVMTEQFARLACVERQIRRAKEGCEQLAKLVELG
jgi:hypothetical protein